MTINQWQLLDNTTIKRTIEMEFIQAKLLIQLGKEKPSRCINFKGEITEENKGVDYPKLKGLAELNRFFQNPINVKTWFFENVTGNPILAGTDLFIGSVGVVYEESSKTFALYLKGDTSKLTSHPNCDVNKKIHSFLLQSLTNIHQQYGVTIEPSFSIVNDGVMMSFSHTNVNSNALKVYTDAIMDHLGIQFKKIIEHERNSVMLNYQNNNVFGFNPGFQNYQQNQLNNLNLQNQVFANRLTTSPVSHYWKRNSQ